MNIDVAKRMVQENLLLNHTFLYKGNRNQNEQFSGSITKMFPAIFIIQVDGGLTKSFCYSDLIVGNLQILS